MVYDDVLAWAEETAKLLEAEFPIEASALRALKVWQGYLVFEFPSHGYQGVALRVGEQFSAFAEIDREMQRRFLAIGFLLLVCESVERIKREIMSYGCLRPHPAVVEEVCLLR